MENHVTRAIELVGGQAELAKRTGVTPQAVHKWARSGVAPPKRVLAIEAATNGSVTRYDLRPDIYGEGDAA